MAVADFADSPEIPRNRRDRTSRGADHGFGNKGHHRFRAEFRDFGFKFARDPQSKGFGGLVVPPVPVFVAGRDVVGFEQERFELCPPPLISACRKRAQRIAVIALATRDDVATLRLTPFVKILPRHFEGGFGCLRSAGHVIHTVQIARRKCGQPVCQDLRRLGCVKRRVCEGDPVELVDDCLLDIGVGMPKARYGGTAARIEIFVAVGVVDIHSVPVGNDGQHRFWKSVKHMIHGTTVGAITSNE